MKGVTQIKERTNQSDAGSLIETCQRCTNQYALVRLKESDDYNDFGDRYCPFCGLHTDDVNGSVLGLYPAMD